MVCRCYPRVPIYTGWNTNTTINTTVFYGDGWGSGSLFGCGFNMGDMIKLRLIDKGCDLFSQILGGVFGRRDNSTCTCGAGGAGGGAGGAAGSTTTTETPKVNKNEADIRALMKKIDDAKPADLKKEENLKRIKLQIDIIENHLDGVDDDKDIKDLDNIKEYLGLPTKSPESALSIRLDNGSEEEEYLDLDELAGEGSGTPTVDDEEDGLTSNDLTDEDKVKDPENKEAILALIPKLNPNDAGDKAILDKLKDMSGIDADILAAVKAKLEVPKPSETGDDVPTVDNRASEDTSAVGEALSDLNEQALIDKLGGKSIVDITSDFLGVIDTSDKADFVSGSAPGSIRNAFLTKENGEYKITVFLHGRERALVYTLKTSPEDKRKNTLVFSGNEDGTNNTQEYELRANGDKWRLMQYSDMAGHNIADVHTLGRTTKAKQDKKIEEFKTRMGV